MTCVTVIVLSHYFCDGSRFPGARSGDSFFEESQSCFLPFWFCVACLAAAPGETAPNVGSLSKTSDLTVYHETRAKLDRGADANVRMALWCEAHGLYSD